jgi:hypothetical protein
VSGVDILMKCGHTAQGTTKDDAPVCVICWGRPEAVEVETQRPSLEGRTARCGGHRGAGGTTPSSWRLPFFKHQPEQPTDDYYCGCFGWD